MGAASADRADALQSSAVKTLPEARRSFLRRPSPWLIFAGVAAVAAARVAVGAFGWGDAAAVAAMLVVYPFGEWAIHVFLLHMKPFELRGRRVLPVAARAHRAHHREPADLDQVLLYWWQVASLLLLAVPLTVLAGAGIAAAFAGGLPWGPILTGLITGYALVFAYEWTHHLIHTAYVPRSRVYRSIWRNHRLHHFKNERFWHGVTQNLSDRVLGTNPDQREVPKSKTARTLGAGPTG
ncbi:MAG: sterol desaturase family protein [Solirubrobacterales bacterium]